MGTRGAAVRRGVGAMVRAALVDPDRFVAADHQATSYHRINGLLQMRKCLAEGYPFVFGFTVYTAFESDRVAKTGALDLPKSDEKNLEGHAVCAVGYDDKTKRIRMIQIELNYRLHQLF